MTTEAPSRPIELKPGLRVTFVQNDGSLAMGTINGPPWMFWDGSAVLARVPVAADDGQVLDVAGQNIRGAS